VETPANVSLIPSRGGHTYMLDHRCQTPRPIPCKLLSQVRGVMVIGDGGSPPIVEGRGFHARPRGGLSNYREKKKSNGNGLACRRRHDLVFLRRPATSTLFGFVEGHDYFSSDQVDARRRHRRITGQRWRWKAMEGAGRDDPDYHARMEVKAFTAYDAAAKRLGARWEV